MPVESITSDTTNATKPTTSKSESEEKEKTAAEDEIHSTAKNVIKSQSPKEETKRLISMQLLQPPLRNTSRSKTPYNKWTHA